MRFLSRSALRGLVHIFGRCQQEKYKESMISKAKRRYAMKSLLLSANPWRRDSSKGAPSLRISLITKGKANLSTPYVTFKLMNYNVLAQTHMMTHIRNYKNCPRECLNWSFRKGILSQELKMEKPDIFCLQEVEGSHRKELLEPLSKMGYDTLYVPRGEGKPDGCALLYNASKFQITDFAPALYFRPEMPLLDRPNVGMVATLELREHPGNCITVANTHFLYNQRRLDIKLSQLQILLAETERLAFAGLPDKYHPVILTGDLNVNPDTCLISLLRNRYVNCRNFNGQWRPVRDSEGRQLSVPDELLRDYLNISPDCQYTDVVEGRRRGIKDVKKTENLQETLDSHRVFPEKKFGNIVGKEKIIETQEVANSKFGKSMVSEDCNDPEACKKSGILRHGFPFIDVYLHPELDKVKHSWLSKPERKQNVYDYIFYSGDLQLKHRTAPFKPIKGLQLLSRLRMPSVPEYKSHFRNLPNFACGSDHLPLIASFLLPIH